MAKKEFLKLGGLFLLIIACIVFIFWTMSSAADESLAKKEAAKAETVEVVEEVIAEEEIDGSEHDPDFEYVGNFRITFYCGCEICNGEWTGQPTALGTTPSAGRTVGTDWAMLPAGTVIYIDGLGEYTVEDKVAGWVADEWNGWIIDVYCNDHQEALDLGVMRKDVWVLEW